jgi:hypothetical protein
MLEVITSLAQVIGAIGVISSLLYVGKQLKQTNSMARSVARQALSEQINDWAMAVASSPSLAECFSKVHFQRLVREDATELERTQIVYAVVGFLWQIHLAYEMNKEGILTQKELNDLYGPSGPMLRQPYMRSLWPALRPGYPPDFQQWFDQRFNFAGSNKPEAVAS